MRVLFQTSWTNAGEWLRALEHAGPELELIRAADGGNASEIEAAVVWDPAPELLAPLTGLKVICVLGAGVDQILALGAALPDVPMVRIVDPLMAERMASYVLAATTYLHRRFHVFAARQQERHWSKLTAPDTGDVRVSVLGLGTMGAASAALLAGVGYRVAGWSRSARAIDGVECLSGMDALPGLMARTDILVCLLPLTPETRGLLAAPVFDLLPTGAGIVNAGRGSHVVIPDLLQALDTGRLGGAVLDVFETEPLPPSSPLWIHPKVLITPHVASITHPATAAPQIVEALRAAREGRPLANLVDRRRGY